MVVAKPSLVPVLVQFSCTAVRARDRRQGWGQSRRRAGKGARAAVGAGSTPLPLPLPLTLSLVPSAVAHRWHGCGCATPAAAHSLSHWHTVQQACHLLQDGSLGICCGMHAATNCPAEAAMHGRPPSPSSAPGVYTSHWPAVVPLPPTWTLQQQDGVATGTWSQQQPARQIWAERRELRQQLAGGRHRWTGAAECAAARNSSDLTANTCLGRARAPGSAAAPQTLCRGGTWLPVPPGCVNTVTNPNVIIAIVGRAGLW